MKKRVLISMAAFSAFSLLGPLVWVICHGFGHLHRQVFCLIILTFPAVLFSAGIPRPAFLSLAAANIVLFAVLGALVGVVASRVTMIAVAYLGMSALLSGLTGWYAGFQLGDFQWLAFIAALLLYTIPFGIVWYWAT